ncbi:MAG: OmpA family protein [Prevotella sp.]|nr:OmpA family protein [Prevotella sp.]
MNMKKIMLSAMLMLGFISASAQGTQERKVLRTDYIFEPHWYVQLQPIGGQYTLGEVDFQKLLSWNVQGAIGYNFTPYIGARLSVNAWQSKAGTEAFHDFNGNEISARQEWSWKYIAPMADLTVNLSNMIMGNYNPMRAFNLGAFVGIGANFGWGNDKANKYYTQMMNSGQTFLPGFEPFRYLWGKPHKDKDLQTLLNVHFGLTGDIRLNDRFSINLEMQANTLSDRYNSKRADNSDWYFNALAGVKINLGKTYHTETIYEPEPKIEYREKIVKEIVEVPVPCPEEEEVIEPLRRDIFFSINKSNIAPGEQQKVDDVVAYLKEHPKAKVTVTGYADKGTGNATINARLGLNRSKIVVEELVKKGIDRSRIIADSKGDTEQPFAENNKNRVTICIAQ